MFIIGNPITVNKKPKKMKRTVFCLILIYISTSIVHGADMNSPCGDYDWIPFGDEKCVKLFTSFETRHRAEEVCNQQDSTLIIINSAIEQKFLIEYVFNTSDSNNVWIGAERRLDSSTEFDWNDGTPVQRFTNWQIGRPSNVVSRSCVQMQSILSRELSQMEWVDVSCTVGNWFICEKLQACRCESLQQAILSMNREMIDMRNDFTTQLNSFTNLINDMMNDFTNQMTEMRNTLTTQQTQLNSNTNLITDTRNILATQGTQINSNTNQITTNRNTLTTQQTQLNSNTNLITDTRNTLTTQGLQVQALQANPVPINFIYVQLPNQPEPRTIWGNVGWTEITSQYAGLFFRAQGGGSAAFGTIQAENSPRLTAVRHMWIEGPGPHTIDISC